MKEYKVKASFRLLAEQLSRLKKQNHKHSVEANFLRRQGDISPKASGNQHEALIAKSAKLNAKLRNIIDNAMDGIITINEAGIVETFNPACEKIFGYKADEVVGNNIKMLMPEPHQSNHDKYISNYKETGKAKFIGVRREVEGRHKDGTLFCLDLSISEVNLGDRRIFTGIARDITERTQAQRTREQLINQLTMLNEQLEQFAYVASHDLREPIRTIANFANLLEEEFAETIGEEGGQYLTIIRQAAQKMEAMIADLLEYSRLDQESERFSEVDCNLTLHHVLDMLNEAIKSTHAVIGVSELPHVIANPTRLFRLLQNLISNGLKYQPAGNIPIISISAQEKGDFWQFMVADNGIGIKPEFFEQIFLPFKRLHNQQEYTGTGIGLAICKRIVESFHGNIWVESVFGGGSIFFFTIPK